MSVLWGVLLVGPLLGQTAEKDATKKEPAYLKVTVPPDNKWAAEDFHTQLKIDDTPTTQKGTTRNFMSPPLAVNKRYVYNLTVVFTTNNYTKITRKREVVVEPGKTTEVDLTTEDKSSPDHIEVRYVPTPWEVVYKMLELAEVKEGDVVWDLGCGDGRLPTAAVEKFKAKHGYGFDIKPELIELAKKQAKEHGVADKTEFKIGDIQKMEDYSPADVVTLYIGGDLNLFVKPYLLKTLKPGSRVVSHRFLMGDWKPDKTIKMMHDGDTYELHLWKIGAKKEEKKEDKKEEK
jgi:uncharacterized protein (TIGR03000 family)